MGFDIISAEQKKNFIDLFYLYSECGIHIEQYPCDEDDNCFWDEDICKEGNQITKFL
jgi:hypothetical protein